MSEDRGLAALRAPTALARTGEIPSLRRVQRAETVGALLKSVASFGIWTLAGLMALGTLGLDLGPLIAGAGIVGVAVGFGSQNLVRDFISGIFMLMEDQYGVGDVVDAGPATGTVEGVGAAHHPAAGRQRHPLAHPQRRDPPGRQPLPGLGPGAGRRRGRLLDRPRRHHPDHRAGRPRAVRRRTLGAQDPGAARGLGGRGTRPRRHPGPPGRQDPPPRAVEGGPGAPGPPQGRLRPGRHRGLGPEGPPPHRHRRRPGPASRLTRAAAGSSAGAAVLYSRERVSVRRVGATEAGGTMANPDVFAMVLAGGEGKRLAPLTADRAKPAVPFGGTTGWSTSCCRTWSTAATRGSRC